MKYKKVSITAFNPLNLSGMSLNDISSFLYKYGAKSRDAQAIIKAIKEGSPMPVVRRMWNKWLGKNIVRRLWWKK